MSSSEATPLLQRRSSGSEELVDAMDGVHHTTAGNALSALFNRHVYSMPLRAFRPPNEPLRYSGMLLR